MIGASATVVFLGGDTTFNGTFLTIAGFDINTGEVCGPFDRTEVSRTSYDMCVRPSGHVASVYQMGFRNTHVELVKYID